MTVLGYMFILGSANADDCGCVGITRTFGWGDTITESCTLNCDLASDETCWTVGSDNLIIDGAGYTISCLNRDGNSYGIHLDGRSNVTIQNIGIEEFNEGIRAENCEYIDILDSVISDNQWWEGIVFFNTTNSTISGNTMEGNGLRTGGEAISFSNSSDNQITGNTLDNNGAGIILFDSSDNNTITDNLVTSNERDGIKISSSSDSNTLISNKFCSNGWSWATTAGYSDIRVIGGSGNTGDNNFCDSAVGYNDTGTTGCTFSCLPGWITDYNGDGTSDIAVFRSPSGLWAIRDFTRLYFGGSSDLPQPSDYDGDGTTDIGIFRSSSGLWAVHGVTRVYFGAPSDEPVPGDYGGDGTCYPTIFRSSSGLWAIREFTRYYFGASSDRPVPADYRGDGFDDIGIFRPASGLWAVRGITRIYFGGSSDIPVTR